MAKNKKKNPGQNNPKNNFCDDSQESLYVKNLTALRKCYPELVQLMGKTVVANYDIDGEPGKPLNLYCKKERLLYYDSKDPIQDVADQIAALKLKNTRFAFFLGMGLGYELHYFSEAIASQQNTSAILVVEKDPQIFKAALKSTDLTYLIENPRIRFLVGIEEAALYTHIRSFLAESRRFILIKAMKPVYHPSSLRLNKSYYFSALKAFRESGTYQLLLYGNDPRDSLIGIENMLNNLQEILDNPGINLLYKKFAGKPAIVASTGPSLNKNKHLLKGLEDQALILCPDTSLKVLLDIGVKPHLVTSLERTPGTVGLLGGFTADQVDDVYLAGCPVIVKEVYERYPGPRVIVYRDLDHFKWLGVERGILDIKKSSGNMAFKVAEALGCDPIILIGQDLAFGEDGTTHASGTARGESGEKLAAFEQSGTLEVPGNNGKPVKTSNMWYQFLKTYEIDVAEYSGTCVNSTEGGAYIQGTIVMPFKESIEKYIRGDFYPLQIIKDNLNQFSADNIEADIDRVSRLMDETISDIEAIIENCREGISVYEKYRTELEEIAKNTQSGEWLKERLEVLKPEVLGPKDIARGRYRTYQLFLYHVLQSYHIQFEMELIALPDQYDDPDHAEVEILLRHAEWYAVIGNLTSICLNSLLEARSKLQSRIRAANEQDTGTVNRQ